MKTTLLAAALIISFGAASAQGMDYPSCLGLEMLRPGVADTLKACRIAFEDAVTMRAWLKRVNADDANISSKEREQNIQIEHATIWGPDKAKKESK